MLSMHVRCVVAATALACVAVVVLFYFMLLKHNLRRLTTAVHAKELEQPPLVALGSPLTDE
jgi:hypothetical protein